MKPGFERLDWSAPIDVDAYLTACPDAARVKGVVIHGMLRHLEKRGMKPPPGVGPFHTFKDYPLREHMTLTVEVAKRAFPHAHLRESLRRLGWATFPAMRETLIGKVVLGAFDEPRSVFRAINKVYEIIGTTAQGKIIEHGPHFVHTHTKDAFGFFDTFHVGSAEGMVETLGRKADVTIKRHSLSENELYIEW